MKFSKLLTLIQETSFTELPDTPFYGFWITSGGDFVIVRTTASHDVVAKKMVLSNPNLKERFIENRSLREHNNDAQIEDKLKNAFTATDYLHFLYFNQHYIRAVKSDSRLMVGYDDTYTPNNAQKRTMRDLGRHYSISVINDKGRVLFSN